MTTERKTELTEHLRLPVPGAHFEDNGCRFTVWAPKCKKVSLFLPSRQSSLPMEQLDHGYFSLLVPDLPPGTNYLYELPGGKQLPDPASHFQPQGVFGPSCVVNHTAYGWNDCGSPGVRLSKAAIYEMHIGTFTPEGTFEAAADKLEELADMGITCVELMPLAQFSGSRNWGYDGVFPFAVHNTYGGPHGLKYFVDTAHCTGLSVVLDVVYNHIGPEGNVLHHYGHYFTDSYATPWGQALNFDGPHSDPVRAFFLANAHHWFTNYHIDGLRLDAVQEMYDTSCRPILSCLTEMVSKLGTRMCKELCMIAESDANDARIVLPREQGGTGMQAQWSDDFHHAMHAALTHETYGYYKDFNCLDHVAASLSQGFSYTGQYSRYWKRARGTAAHGLAPSSFVACIQNHDQIGNRPRGERLDSLVSFEARKLAAACLLLGQHTPMIFMGEEYAENNPFCFFVNFHNPALNQAVRKGRQKELRNFRWRDTPPAPDDEATFKACVLDWNKRDQGHHKQMLAMYTKLLEMRAASFPEDDARVWNSYVCLDQDKKVLALRRTCHTKEVVTLFHFSARTVNYSFECHFARHGFHVLFDTGAREFGGAGHGPVFPEDGTVRLTPWQVLVLKAK